MFKIAPCWVMSHRVRSLRNLAGHHSLKHRIFKKMFYACENFTTCSRNWMNIDSIDDYLYFSWLPMTSEHSIQCMPSVRVFFVASSCLVHSKSLDGKRSPHPKEWRLGTQDARVRNSRFLKNAKLIEICMYVCIYIYACQIPPKDVYSMNSISHCFIFRVTIRLSQMPHGAGIGITT